MKKRIISVLSLFLIMFLLFVNRYLEIEYSLNLYEYLSRSKRLTKEELNYLKSHGDIIYASDYNSPPLRYLDTANGQYRGVVIDYINALSIELGTQIKVRPMIWKDALDSLADGKTDICDMYPSTNRSKLYLFSKPIYIQRSVILVLKDNEDIKDYKDLETVKVAAQKGDYVIEFLNSKLSNINYSFTEDYLQAIKLLQEGKVDAVVGDEPVISHFITLLDINDDVAILDKPLYERDSVLSVHKSEKKLLTILNKCIYNLNRANTMNKIQQKWFGISTPITKNTSNEKYSLLIAFFGFSIIMVFYLSYLWNKHLKKEVTRQTEKLDISRNDLQTTFDGLTHLMLVLNKDFIITNVNQSVCDLLGLDKEDIIGKKCNDFSKDFELGSSCLIRRTLSTNSSHQKEIQYKNKLFEITSYPLLDQHNNVDRVLLMLKDITQLRISERQILHSSKMVAIGQLAGGVAHEIRNPLGIIRNSSYLLKKQLKTKNEVANKSIWLIENSVERASNIIDNLLNFSRLSSNNISKINVLKFIEGIMELNKKAIKQQNIDVLIMCDSNLECMINVEALKHILLNIISNAIDALSDKGCLTINCDIEDTKLVIICNDNGCGIDNKNIDKIFDPFYTTKEPGKGTGLGLYVVYDQVKKIGGDIRVTSNKEIGTTFTLCLPIKED
ncbi:transporter substrate-binding domain-containing protein [Clostridiaceae bacterium M8S5]|nr:transporter substrate-binding domain-containing protein [Clostridiaceae bacterium M8S5]